MAAEPTNQHTISTSSADAPQLTGRPWLLPTIALLTLAGALATLSMTQTPSASVMWPRWTAIMLMAWWLPGALLVAHWRLNDLDLPMAAVLAMTAGLCWMLLLSLITHWWPGRIEFWPMVAVYAVGAFGLAIGLFWRPPHVPRPTPPTTWAWLLALLVLATFLRLPGLGYHEFHYDETIVLARARDAIRGEDDAFARHTKGPGELALATVVYRTLGTANESTARLLFGITSVVAVLGVALLARGLFGDEAGFWAGVLFAMNGFVIGLTRIVQYQAIVLLLMVTAVYAAWMFARRGEVRWIVLAGLLGAFGLVLHYEFGLVALALFWLLWLGWSRCQHQRSLIFSLAGVGLFGTFLFAATYLPSYLHPYFATTQYYLTDRMGGLGQTFNLAFFVEVGTFYNSIYFFGGLVLLVIIGLVIGWRRPDGFQATWLLFLWFAPYLLLYLFIIQYPGTHFYLLMPSWSILAALSLAAITGPSVSRWIRYPVAPLIVVWLALSANYLHLLFFRQNPEYVVNFQQEQSPLYWAPYGDRIPEKPRFGFPIWEGWKTLGVLSEWGYLDGTYTTNERSRHLRWYLGALEFKAIEEAPEYIFVAQHLQEPEPRFDDDWLDGYNQVGEVRVRGEPRIAIWSTAIPAAGYLTYDAETFDDIFDGQAPTFREWPDPPATVVDQPLGDQITLVQAGAEPARLAAGDLLHLLTVWRPEQPLDRDYKLFVHIADAEGRPLAQWDGLPGMNTQRTSQWPVGEPFRDHTLVRLPNDMPAGRYQVLVGLYDGESGERVGGQAVFVGEIEVR